MSSLTALAVSVGLLAGLATYLFVSDIWGLGLYLWAAFITWGAFFHSGGKEQALVSTIACSLFGVVAGIICVLLLNKVDLGLSTPIWLSIIVTLAAFLIVLASSIPLFSTVPVVFYGFAAFAALIFLKGIPADDLLVPSLGNPAVAIGLSLIMGAVFGYVSEKLTGMLASS